MTGALPPLRAAMEMVCIHSNPDWAEGRSDPAATLDQIHKVATEAFYAPTEPRAAALTGAMRAAEAVHELMKFAREGNQMATAAFAISVVENLADAIRLALNAQGGPEDEDEARFYAAVKQYLDGPGTPTESHQSLQRAIRDVLERRSSTYRAKNGREVGIQGEDGEKVWLVHSDEMSALEMAFANAEAQP